ncbi:MAG: stage II sporulation protein M [Candidatus Woesearchaeota archaeon]
MVLEQAIKIKWLQKKEHSFFIGFIYSLIAIGSAYLILPSYTAMASIAFTAVLLLPSINKLLAIEEKIEIKQRKKSVLQLLKDNKDIIKIYLFMFFGIFIAYLLVALSLPQETSRFIFDAQLTLTGIIGKATGADFFTKIVLNNLLVFIVCFILSLFYGAGAVLFLTVNASAWGSYFGYVLRNTIIATNESIISTFFFYIIRIMPHTILEALSYIFAAIAGGVISKAILKEKIFSKEFNKIIIDSLIILSIGIIIVILAGLVETIAYNKI